MTRVRDVRPTTWLTAGVLLLLPVLAVMQHRWLERIGDDVGTRMRVVAENAARALARDLDFELLRAWRARLAGSDARLGDADADPALISGALLIDRPDSGSPLRVHRWDPERRECPQIPWPEELAALRERIDERLARDSDHEGGRALVPFQRAGPPLGVFPLPDALEGEPASTPRPPCPVTGPTLVLVQFDTARVRDRLLPELFRRHVAGVSADFRFALVEAGPHPGIVFAPGQAEAPAWTHAPDVAVPVLLGRQGRPRGGPEATAEGRGVPRWADTRRARPPGREAGHDDDPSWSIVGQHRAGSLDAAVSGLRHRNLVVSLAILLLMGVAVLLIAANARRAEALGRQQVEFVASVSHEMRTPVSAIDVAARNLEDGLVSDPSRVRQYGSVIRSEARRLAETVERVLQVAALDSGRGLARRTLVDVRATAQDVVDQARRDHPHAVVELVHDGGHALVSTDPAMLRSCVQNLVANALKYGGAPGWVRVRIERAEGRVPEVRVVVEDHGPGIDARDRRHVFEPFYRGRLAIDRRLPGNGLGLHIVKRCLEAMGGRVEIAASGPSGTTFVLALPASETAAGTHAGEAGVGPADLEP